MHGHVIGNLLIVALWEQLGDHVARRSTGWAGCSARRGRVLPMALTPLDITAAGPRRRPGRPDARDDRARPGRGGHQRGRHPVRRPRPRPTRRRAPRRSTPSATADWVVLGPGSLVHLRDPAPAGARAPPGPGRDRWPGRWSCSTWPPQAGETPGFDPADHLAALLEHAPDLQVAHRAGRPPQRARPRRRLEAPSRRPGRRAGGRRRRAPTTGRPRHDPAKLAAAYDAVIEAALPARVIDGVAGFAAWR